MTVQVTIDPVQADYEMGVGCEYNPKSHMIVQSSFVEGLKRRFKKPNLFMYFHRYRGTFVLAQWHYHPDEGKGPGLMIELEVWDGKPDWGYPVPNDEYFAKRLRPSFVIQREIGKMVREKAKAEKRRRINNQEEQKRVGKWMRKQGWDHSGKLMEDLAVPYDPSPSEEAIAEGRII